jgi:hypothetical protein
MPSRMTASHRIAIAVPGRVTDAGRSLDPAERARVHIPPYFIARVRLLLTPGTTMLVTDLPVLEETTGRGMTVVTADPPPAA